MVFIGPPLLYSAACPLTSAGGSGERKPPPTGAGTAPRRRNIKSSRWGVETLSRKGNPSHTDKAQGAEAFRMTIYQTRKVGMNAQTSDQVQRNTRMDRSPRRRTTDAGRTQDQVGTQEVGSISVRQPGGHRRLSSAGSDVAVSFQVHTGHQRDAAEVLR
jgi:hypothetical protein